jgi:hypothetical protein
MLAPPSCERRFARATPPTLDQPAPLLAVACLFLLLAARLFFPVPHVAAGCRWIEVVGGGAGASNPVQRVHTDRDPEGHLVHGLLCLLRGDQGACLVSGQARPRRARVRNKQSNIGLTYTTRVVHSSMWLLYI